MDVAGRMAVVTGAGSGLGRAAARALTERGARVALLDRVSERVVAVADEIGAAALPLAVDVADEASVREVMRTVAEELGTVHVCINAAGVPGGGKVVADGRALALSEFRRVIDINLVGAFDVMRRCAELMVANVPDEQGERGVIVNVSSGAAWQGQRGGAAYAASKAGVIGMMLSTARDLAEFGVRVVSVAPGLFATGMTADVPDKFVNGLSQVILNPKRMGNPDEFAALVAHIVENSYLNATTISIDAGMRA